MTRVWDCAGRARGGRGIRTLAAIAAVLLPLAALAVCTPLGAQPNAIPVGIRRLAPRPLAPDSLPSPAAPRPFRWSGLVGRDSSWWVPLSSAVVPGWGQVRLGQTRFVAYLAVEAYAIVGYLNDEAALDRERNRFITLAHDIARAFVPGNDKVGNWDYYEAMEKHIESGVFDRTPGTGVLSPEVDTTTYNGSIWLRARRLSGWPDPDAEPSHSSALYQAAVSYYIAHAVGPEYRWSWRNAQLEWDLYRETIRRKNDVGREAEQFLSVIAVNHLLSAVDAFVTLRLRGGVGANRQYRLTTSLPLPW